jgi:nucleoside-diphosphate-sugar epimerase
VGELVLVTGGSGYIAGWCIVELLKRGYEVRTTVRGPGKEAAVSDAVRPIVDPTGRLSYAVADLTEDQGWAAAVEDVAYVLHVASPLGISSNDPDRLIAAARDGAVRVLRAAAAAGVRRVVMTSAANAASPSSYASEGMTDETLWTDPDDPTLIPYRRSKTLAERAAWDFKAGDAGRTELTTVLPGAVFGPILTKSNVGSVGIVGRMISGAMPGVPRIALEIVDVRDLVDLHIRAMTSPAAAGERFLGTGELTWMRDMARILRDGLGPRGRRVSTRQILPELTRSTPAIVINTVGPFTRTAVKVAGACPPGTHYVDVTNELQSVEAILDLDQDAVATGRVLVTGAGFGVLATEGVLLHVCADRPPASLVRVDALPSVATQAGVLGSALAASIVDVLSFGGREVRRGRLVRSPIGRRPMRLTTPDGDVVSSAGVPTGELLAAWRSSRAASVTAASSLAPSGGARLVMPVISAALRIPGVDGLAIRRMARMPVPDRDRPRRHSWAHARAEWPSGEVREAWLRAGEAMDFTVGSMVEVTLRLARGEGRPGAHTPGALFGAKLALAAGGEFMSIHAPGSDVLPDLEAPVFP